MKINDIEDDNIIKKLKKYVHNPNYKHELYSVWDELIERYPYNGGIIYRGINFETKDSFDKFVKSLPTIKINQITSWTTDKSEAENFAKYNPKFIDYMSFSDAENIQYQKDQGENIVGYAGIVLSMTIPRKLGVDVGESNLSLENEVLIPSGSYTVKYEIFNNYKTQTEYQDVNEIVKNLDYNEKDMIYYILKNKSEQLTIKSWGEIFNILTEKQLQYNVNDNYDITLESYTVSLNINYPELLINFKDLFPRELVNKYIKNNKHKILSLINDLDNSLSDKPKDTTIYNIKTLVKLSKFFNVYNDLEKVINKNNIELTRL